MENSLRKNNYDRKNTFMHFIKLQERKQRSIVNHLQNEINQSIISAKLKNDLVEKQTKHTSTKQTCIEIKRLLEKAFQDIYTISLNIYPLPIDDIGFKYAIEDLSKNVMKDHNIQIKYNIHSKTLPYEIRIILYRIMENFFSNMGRKSKDILVNLAQENNSIILKVNWSAQRPLKIEKLKSLFSELKEYITLLNGTLNFRLSLNRIIAMTIIIPHKNSSNESDKKNMKLMIK